MRFVTKISIVTSVNMNKNFQGICMLLEHKCSMTLEYLNAVMKNSFTSPQKISEIEKGAKSIKATKMARSKN